MMIFLAAWAVRRANISNFFSIQIPTRSHERTAEEKKRKGKAERKNRRNGKTEYCAIL